MRRPALEMRCVGGEGGREAWVEMLVLEAWVERRLTGLRVRVSCRVYIVRE